MKVVTDLQYDYPDCINTYFNFEKYGDDSADSVLMVGYHSVINEANKQKYKKYSKNYINLEHPCSFYCKKLDGLDAHQQLEYFDKIYSICPYTTKWLNELYGKEKIFLICYPFGTEVIPNEEKKIYDVCYFGGVYSSDHSSCIDAIKDFKYRFISRDMYPHVTNCNIKTKEKLKIIAQTKISVCYNLLHINEFEKNNIKTYNDWEKNEAFSRIDIDGTIPQYKSRINEAAFCKTLNLVKRDKWNVIEYFYKPNEDFLYFDSNDELKDRIQDILNKYDSYRNIIDNAYNKVMNYTAEKIYAKIKANL
jgi:hypothetical protein